jgi:hypothetical protein
MQCACAILSHVARPALQYFSTLSHTQCALRKRKKNIEIKISILIFSTTFVCLRRIDTDMIKICILFSCEVPVILDVLMKLDF